MTVPITYFYRIFDVQRSDWSEMQGKAAFSPGVLQLFHENTRKLGGRFEMSFQYGAGAPLTSGSHERTAEIMNGTMLSSKNELGTGSSLTFSCFAIPVLVNLRYTLKTEGPAITLGLGAGTVLVGLNRRDVEVWWQGTPPSEVPWQTRTSYKTFLVQSWVGLASIGVHFMLGTTDSIGLLANAGLMSEGDIDDAGPDQVFEMKRPDHSLNPILSGVRIGGLTYGLNLGWERMF